MNILAPISCSSSMLFAERLSKFCTKFCFAAIPLFSCFVVQQDQDSNDFKTIEAPPISRIIMFNSGMAQFFHEGDIDGNCRVEMNFTDGDIDNVLKSLVFEDKTDGTIRSVEFKPAPDQQDVAAQKLGPPLTLAQTLQKYRGEGVTIETAAGAFDGNLWSVENRQIGTELFETVTLVGEQGFQSITISEIKMVKFADRKLQDEIRLAMSGLTETRTTNLKKVELDFEGIGKRTVRFSYNVDSPIWRMTYRLNITENKANLQGWAHIDNVTGVDWKQIDLDLRSGRPQSFHVDLFRPVLAVRPSVGLGIFGLPVERVINPSLFGNDQFDDAGFAGKRIGMGGGGGGFGGGGFGGGGLFGGDAEPDDTDAFDMETSVGPVSIPTRPAQLVQFTIEDPVNLKAGRSSIVPVISKPINSRWFSQIDVDSGQKLTEYVALIRNEFKFPLIPGPVTLYRNGDFVGDSIVDRIEPGAVKDLVFGLDSSVILTKHESRTQTVAKKISWSGKHATIYFDSINTQDTSVANRDSIPRNLLLKMTKLGNAIQPKPTEIIGDKLHFEISCKAGETVNRTVTQTSRQEKKIPLSSIAKSSFKQWQEQGAEIPDELSARMTEIFSIEKVLSETRETGRKIQESLTALDNEQKRITKILQVLKEKSETQSEYLNQLLANEKNFKKMNAKLVEVSASVSKLNQQLQKLYE